MMDINSLLSILQDNWQPAAIGIAALGGSIGINSFLHKYFHAPRSSEYLTEFRSGFGRLAEMFRQNKQREYIVGYVHGFDFGNDSRHRLYEPDVTDREQYAEGFMSGMDNFTSMDRCRHSRIKRDRKAFYQGMIEASLQVKGQGYLGD